MEIYERLERLHGLGVKDRQIADYAGVHSTTIYYARIKPERQVTYRCGMKIIEFYDKHMKLIADRYGLIDANPSAGGEPESGLPRREGEG